MGQFKPWLNVAKREMKKLKEGFGRKLSKSGAPKSLWNDCLKLESFIRSNTAHRIYTLSEEVPETAMPREMFNISHFCEFEWFEWVIF